MSSERAAEMRSAYGEDFIALIGGGLHGTGRDLTDNARDFVRRLRRRAGNETSGKNGRADTEQHRSEFGHGLLHSGRAVRGCS